MRGKFFSTKINSPKLESWSFVMFWLLIFVVLCWMDRAKFDVVTNVLANAISVGIYAMLVAINIYYLIPRYLNERKFWWYVFSVIVTALLFTPIRIYTQVLVFAHDRVLVSSLMKSWKLLFTLDLAVVVFSTIYSITTDWFVKRNELKEMERSKLESELNFLKSQINPHFLFNTLNSIYGLSLKKSDRTPDMILRLAEIMRYMLYECNESRVVLSKEISYLENYVALEKIRYGDHVNITLELDGVFENYIIAPLILNGMVENAFKHGVSKRAQDSFVRIYVNLQEGGLFRFEVVNNTPEERSTPKPIEQKHGGIGLQNIIRRLEILYPNSHNLNILPSDDAFRVILEIQLEQNESI